MRTIKLLSCLAVLGALLCASSAAAQDVPARIVKILGSGTATVIVDGHSEAAQEQMRLPVNAEIQTTSQEVYVEVLPGVVSSVKPESEVRVDTLTGPAPALELRQGTLVSEIDKKRVVGKTYSVKTARGVAAARGTSFTVTVDGDSLTVATTADSVSFTAAGGGQVIIGAGMISITPAGAPEVAAAVPISTTIMGDAGLGTLVQDAVTTAATVVEGNLGELSADSATNIISQVVAVAAGAMPSQAVSFTTQAVSAVTAPGAATASMADTAVGAVTAAAVIAAPEQAAQIAGAAARAAPASMAGIIAAAAAAVAPSQSDIIIQQVANATGQSPAAIEASAGAATPQATNAVNAAHDATSNVVAPPGAQAPAATPSAATPSSSAQSTTRSQTNEQAQTTGKANGEVDGQASGQANGDANGQAKGQNGTPGQGDSGKVSPHPPLVTPPPTTPVMPIDLPDVSPSS